MQAGHHTTWLEIDLSAVQQNIRKIQSITNRPVLAVVKGNGYGHGLIPAGRAAAAAGVAWLGVARIEEALALRQGGIGLPVLVMGLCMPDWVSEAISHNISLTVHHPQVALDYAAQARAAGGILNVHAKIDSGMGRLGVFAEEGGPFIHLISQADGLRLEGLFTHMARADEPELNATNWQVDRFSALVNDLQAQGLRPPLVHAASSAATLYFPRTWFDMVRPGIAIYGLHPSPEAPLPEGFRPALTWKARIASVKELPPGSGVGYNYRFITQAAKRVGVVAVGYADGFRRRLGNFALAGGRRVHVLGGVCMDQCMIDLDEVPDARMGDEVVLIGRQGQAQITAETVAAAWDTTNYEVVCGLSARVPRLYCE
jgi:alanine racemase